ncbi:SAM-dependent methyltransferase [Actinokineospora sp. HUAS TT18]|uniref:SAM-dependent methyltransferase n=1 Tax=Actinokineospora sp. HUAS TT18 TaxID=3447451 RepID=UPI003F526CBD
MQTDLTTADVGRFFDEKGDMLAELMGGNLHFAYWTGDDDDSSFAEATDRLTDHMVELLAARPGERVLDLGCGRGRPAVRLAQAVPDLRIVGISVSAKDIAAATELAAAAGVADRVRFEFADAMALPFAAGSFDAVWAVESLLHMPDRLTVLRGVAEVLRPGGRLALCDLSAAEPDTEAGKLALAQTLQGLMVHSLTDLDGYRALLADAGLRVTEAIDVSHRTRYSKAKVTELLTQTAAASGLDFAEIEMPPEMWDQAFAVFERVGYLAVTAERPA